MPIAERAAATVSEISPPLVSAKNARSRFDFHTSSGRAFRSVLDQVAKFARHDSVTIVFEGETGTGKNWLARLAHSLSPRSQREFRQFSLATATETLIGSELFGHEQGAFTGARRKRLGVFQSTSHGTLFLDELGKASLAVQQNLLQVLDEGTLTSVGNDRPTAVDVRIFAATNENLSELVAKERFLQDLCGRLCHFTIRVPPLRERREDIPGLAECFVARYAKDLGYPPGLPTIAPSLMGALVAADWPHNLRDLDGAMHRLVVEADPDTQLTLEHCRGSLSFLRVLLRGRPKKVTAALVVAVVEKERSKSAAARELGISRATLHRVLTEAKRERASRDQSVS